MKKIISAVIGLVLGSFAFAYSDFSFKLAPTMNQETYVLDGKFEANPTSTWDIGIVNYNFFDENNHIGCFESLSYSLSNFSTATVAIGVAGGADANSFIRFQAGLGLHLSYGIESKTSYVSSSYVTTATSNLRFGFLTDFALKLTPHKLFSPVIGFSLIYDPVCSCIVNTDGTATYKAYSGYSNFGLNPYINFCINLN